MFGNIKKLTLLNKLNLSTEEFDFLHYIFLCKQERGLKHEITEQFEIYYENNKHKYDYPAFINKYESLGYIENYNKPTAEHILFNKIVVLPKFLDSLIIDKEKCWQEVLSVYPDKMYVKDRQYLTKMSDKNLKNLYYDIITQGGDRYLHEEFISLTDIFYQNDRPITSREGSVKLEKWIMSWDAIKPTIRAEILGETARQIKIFG